MIGQAVLIGGVVFTFICFTAAIISVLQKSYAGFFYTLAYLIYSITQYRLLIGFIIDVEPPDIYIVQFLYGFSLELIILTIALSGRFLSIRIAKEQAQQKTYTEATALNKLQQSYTESLQKEVDDQTAQLHLANRRKDQLFQLVGNNLRSPLREITSLSDTIEHLSFDKSNRAFRLQVQSIWLTSFNLLTHLENLLNWARLKFEALPSNPKKYNLANIVESTLQTYQPFTQKNRTQFHLKIDKNLFVHVDIHHIKIILRNLIAYTITDKRSLNHINISALKHDSHVRLMIEYSPIDLISHPETEDPKHNHSPEEHFSIRLCRQLLDLYDSQLIYQNAAQGLSLFEFKLNAG